MAFILGCKIWCMPIFGIYILSLYYIPVFISFLGLTKHTRPRPGSFLMRNFISPKRIVAAACLADDAPDGHEGVAAEEESRQRRLHLRHARHHSGWRWRASTPPPPRRTKLEIFGIGSTSISHRFSLCPWYCREAVVGRIYIGDPKQLSGYR